MQKDQKDTRPRTPLPARRERFALELVANGGHQARAAVAAGYSKDRATVTGSELVADRNVWQRIQEERERAYEALHLTAQTIIQGVLTEAMNLEASPDARIRAWRTLGEWRGLGAGMGPGAQVDARSVTFNVTEPEQLRALLELGLAALPEPPGAPNA